MTLAAAMVVAEERLRACGWTGARAFDELLEAIRERLGAPARPSAQAREVAAELPLNTGEDLLGLAYERFFADLFKGRRGQFFTPGPVCVLLLSRLDLRPGDTVLDPTCGSGGLLVHAARRGASVRGIELDPRLAQLASLNLRMAGHARAVRQADFFRVPPEPVDIVVANPPFSIPLRDPELLSRFELGRGQRTMLSDVLFLEALEDWVRPGGRAGVVLPWSVFVNDRFEAVRGRVDAAWRRLGVCELPEGVFRPFGGAAGRAGLLWLERKAPGQSATVGEPAWWAVVRDPGYDVRRQHFKATDEQEIRDLASGRGWAPLPPGAWVPQRSEVPGTPVGDHARLAPAADGPLGDGPVWVLDLANADRSTGEAHPRRGAVTDVASRRTLQPGDVLVARLRPNLGNVARAPEVPGRLVGSPEWVALRASHPGWLLHALRTPAFRQALPSTGGQTRPRVSADGILQARVPRPAADLVARVDALSGALFAARQALREQLDALQAAVDAFTAGEIDEAGLRRALEEIHPLPRDG